MNKKVIVLGAGLVGSTIAVELSKQYEVTVVDLNEGALSKLKRCFGIKGIQADVTERKTLENLIEQADLVVGAVPGFLGFDVIKRVIDAGKNMVDISFFPEDPFELDERAKYKKVSIAIDSGIAPGVSNMILGYHVANMKVDRYECVVGGLPLIREWPWNYKAVFSPSDVIEEYVRPARYVENYKQITKEALSDPELINFKNVGTLEAWNSDGLRTLLKTMKVPNMIEKTLRYPGSIEYLKVLRESGFFSQKTIEVNGVSVRPLDVTTKLLLPLWELKKGDEDFTIMRSKVMGSVNGEPIAYEYLIYDTFDQKSGNHSMARTTGYTCTAVAELFLEGLVENNGIIPPEILAEQKDIFPRIMTYLEERGIKITVDRLY
jgi:saccharopine dehydrogenase-like NADP-dependent oxidoreductase